MKNGSLTRLKNVIDGDTTGISSEVGFNGGGDFIYCELMQYNQVYMGQKSKPHNQVKKFWTYGAIYQKIPF